MGLSISCQDVTKSYKGDGVQTHALNHVSLEIDQGEFVAIVGPSGSGKSTLLSLVGTLDTPTEGTLFYNNQSMSTMNSKALADFRFEHIGFIFQQFHLLPTLTALENVMVPLFSRRVPYDKKERAEQLLEQVGLKDKLSSLPSQLSGGQQQRVAIARALIHHPSWLLADEPTGNLDTETGDIIFELISHLNKTEECGVLFVTHDPNLAAKADRIIEMKDGRILRDSKGAAL